MEEIIEKPSVIEVVNRCRDGSRSSFRELYELYKDRMYSLCVRMLGNTEDAEDALQETFVRVFRSLGSFRGESSFHTWLYRIATNTCIEHLRKRKREYSDECLDDPDQEISIPYDPEHTDDLKLFIEQALEKLPNGCRSVFILHAVEGFKHREIAEMLDITEGTSKSQLSLAKEHLRKQLLPSMEV